MSVGIECLLTDNSDKAMALALQLDELNRQRREVEQSMQLDALAIVEKISLDQSGQPAIYTLYDETWHQGVVGLVASRIKDRTDRPVVALAPGDKAGEWKGSARSVEGIHIRDLLARLDAVYPRLMSKFGGHAMAAGLSLPAEKIAEFQAALSEVAEQLTAGRDWSHTLWTDGELDADDFHIELADQLRLLTPWGQAFPEPVFDGQFVVIDARLVGDIHAKLKLQPVGSSLVVDAICFGFLNQHERLPAGTIRAVYRLDVNEFRERITLQLIVQHIE